MSAKDATPETYYQTQMREWYTTYFAKRGEQLAWGRGKDGQYLSQFARDAEAAWQAAQLMQLGVKP